MAVIVYDATVKPRPLTYDDLRRTGQQDCDNAISIDEFDYRGGGTAREIVERTWARWESEGARDQWLSQQDDLDGLDPDQAYQAWAEGWKSCAIHHVESELADRERHDDEDDEAYFVDEGDGILVPEHASMDAALDDAITRVMRGSKQGHAIEQAEVVYGSEVSGFRKMADVISFDSYAGRSDLRYSTDETPEVVVAFTSDGALVSRLSHGAPYTASAEYGPFRSGKRDSSVVAFLLVDDEVRTNGNSPADFDEAMAHARTLADTLTRHGLRARSWGKPGVGARVYIEGLVSQYLSVSRGGDVSDRSRGQATLLETNLYPNHRVAYRRALEEYRALQNQHPSQNPPRDWWKGKDTPRDRLCYPTKREALRAFLHENYDIVLYYGGENHEESPAEFDSINHKYGLKGKRAVRSIADAVWVAMPSGRPFCLDRIDLEALNGISPARELDRAWRLPSAAHASIQARKEAEHYRRMQEEEESVPSWVTEHDIEPEPEPAVPVRYSPVPSMAGTMAYQLKLEHSEPGVEQYSILESATPMPKPVVFPAVKPVTLTLEEREPGVETYRMNPRRRAYNEYVVDEKGRRSKHGYNVVALDPASGVGQDGDTVRSLREAIAWARDIADGNERGAYQGGVPVPMSAIVTAEYDDDNRETVYSVSPHGYPVWQKENSPHIDDDGRRIEDLKSNPAWVTKIVAKHYERLEDSVPAKWLPRLTKAKKSGRDQFSAKMKEYGCGAYGCVLPTLDTSVVLKLTTDDTEAEFASKLGKKLSKPIVVNYHMTIPLEDKYQRAQVHMLWRDSADKVGRVIEAVAERGGDVQEADKAIDKQHKAAQAVYKAMVLRKPIGDLLDKWKVAAREMGDKIPELRFLSEGMLEVLAKDGIFFGDVHDGNVGKVQGKWIIVDPGHVAEIVG